MSSFQRMRPWATGHDRLASRPLSRIEGVVVHRIEVSQEDKSFADTPADIDRFFHQHPIGMKATGGDMPYPILVDAIGVVTQTLPLRVCSPHAVAKNPTTIGVACIGDFRDREPAAAQWQALLHACALLCQQFSLPVEQVFAHDELPGASRDPDKICPGDGLPVTRLRQELGDVALGAAMQHTFTWSD